MIMMVEEIGEGLRMIDDVSKYAFFEVFFIDPGGKNNNPGALGSDSGGEKHQKYTFLKKKKLGITEYLSDK